MTYEVDYIHRLVLSKGTEYFYYKVRGGDQLVVVDLGEFIRKTEVDGLHTFSSVRLRR